VKPMCRHRQTLRIDTRATARSTPGPQAINCQEPSRPRQ
jgi:hypothetical protein